MKTIFSILFCFTATFTIGQDYHRYYELTDSAHYYWKISENSKADSLYTKAFENFIGFPEDYADAAYNIWNENPEKGKAHIAKAFQYGAFFSEVESFLERNNIQVSKKELKRIARRNKEEIKSKRKKRKIIRIFIKDQLARMFFYKRMDKVDSLNRLNFISLVKKDSLLFNRFHVGYMASLLTQPLLFHQVWYGIDSIRNDLIRYIEKGWIHREFLWYAIEREAVFGGKVYTVEKNRPVVDEGKENESLSSHLHYSMVGQISFYNDSLKPQVLVPVSPQKTEAEINALRRAVFLGPLDLYRKSSGKQCPDAALFKTYLH